MKQAILYGPGDLRIEERLLDPSSLAPDEIYAETEVSALSTGTDLGNYLGKSTEVPGAPDYPRWVGYSNVGIIKKIGPAVEGLKVGQRVFCLKPHQSAYIAQSNQVLASVPDTVSSEHASLSYFAGLGVAALRRVHFEPGESVAVVGLGVIGLATVALARAMGAHVTAVANSRLRAEAALAQGAEVVYVIGSPEPPRDRDIVVLTANTWEAYRLSVDVARYCGRVSVLGFPGRGCPAVDFNPLDPRWFYGKQLTLSAAGFTPDLECLPWEIRFNLRRNLEYILGLMARGSVNLERIITHRLPWQRMQEAYELAREHSKSLMAAVFDWRSA